MQRILHKVIAAAVVVCCLCANNITFAAEPREFACEIQAENLSVSRASGTFSVSINPRARITGDSDFPLDVGETVRIYATYSPSGADLDFGLIDSDNVFHYVSAESGNVDVTFEIPESGNYRLGIRNNSAQTVKVSGFVRY